MPILPLFTSTYLLSLLLFHNQPALPAIWAAFHDHFENPNVGILTGQFTWVFIWVLLLGLLSVHGGVSKTRMQTLVFVLVGMAAAQVCAGIQAAAHQRMQVPLECNKQKIQSEFKLIQKAFRDEDSQTWLVEHAPSPSLNKLSNMRDSCIKNGARLQTFIEKADTYRDLLPGQFFRTTVQVRPPRAPLQLEGFDVHKHWFSNQIAGTAQIKGGLEPLPVKGEFNPLTWMERARLQIADSIVLALQDHPEQALVLAMVVGDQGLISAEDRDMFNATGIAHLVAISGLHITLFAMLAGKGMQHLWRRSPALCMQVPAPLSGSAFGLIFAVLYALIAGWGLPAQRTVFMLFALFVAQLRGGMQNSWDTFFLALFLTLSWDNWAVLDAGFVLSFGAVAALIFVTQGHYQFIKPNYELVANAIKTQYTVTIGLILPCAMLFNQQSLISPVANALSIPWMSFVSTPLALLGGLTQQPWALLLAAQSLAVQRKWLTLFNEFSWATLPIHNQPVWVNCLVAFGCLILILPRGLISRWLGVALIALLALPAPRPEENEFWMTLMDVGQGTAIAIQTQNHLLIYDAGPAFNDRSNSSRRVLLPWLAAHGYHHPDMFMLSHDDADHSGGAPLLIDKAPPIQFASSIANDHSLNRLAQEKHSETIPCHTMEKWTWDGITFNPIGLRTPIDAHQKLLAKNNQSCVLKVSNSRHSVLLTGDIEAISEMQLLVQHGAEVLNSTVLVAPHHGSKTSSTLPFLQAVRPEYALIQAGWNNQFGHPHPQVIKRYESMGIRWETTAQNGAIKWTFRSNDSTFEVKRAREQRKRYWHMHETGAK